MTDGFTSTAASRFLRYVTFDTQSSDQSDTYPSTAKQLVLLNLLVEELKAMGVADAAIDQHGYVMASIPPTPGKEHVPVIGFIAHVDTSPDVSGAGVKPIVHKAYDGRDIVLQGRIGGRVGYLHLLTLPANPDLQSSSTAEQHGIAASP